MLAILTVLPAAMALAQDTNPDQLPAPPPLDAAVEMEIPATIAHVTSYGFVIPAGWNLSATADALGVYDSNPAFLLPAAGDAAQRYSGDASLTYLSQHTIYQADYRPSVSFYRQFNSLNSNEQDLSQSVWHDTSPQTSLGWTLLTRKYPSWGGSAFAGSSFGSLLMELSGLTALDLKSKVSTANTGFTLEHKTTRRSRLRADISGGVSKYVQIDSNQFLTLLTAPDSSTWSGQMSLSYDYQLGARRTIGVGVSSSYFLFTAESYHAMTQSAVLRYSETLRDGWSYSVSVGPEFREEQRTAGYVEPGLSFSFNAERKTRRSIFRANVMRSYQVGQTQGSLTSWDASFRAEHTIARRCFAGVFASYQQSQSPVSVAQLETGTTQSFAPAMDGGIRLGRHVVWFANYGFSAQKGVLTQEQNIYRQQFVSGLSFNVDSLFPR